MPDSTGLEIAWYGQAMFVISGGGINLVCDPTSPQTGYTYLPVQADVVLVSHAHFDHNYLEGVKGHPQVISSAGVSTAGGIDFTGIRSYHDTTHGQERGENIIFTWKQGGISLCHLGDLGGYPDAGTLSRLKGLDILMIPVGGVYTIDAALAARLAHELSPSAVIPMHYGTDVCAIPLEPVEDFIRLFEGPSRKITERPLHYSGMIPPGSTELLVLPHS